MPNKLIYFPIGARATAMRILLSHAKAEFEDETVTFEQFGERKAAGEFPNGQVPVWVQDGQYYNESKAILRFIGKQHGYYPEDIHAAWDADATVDYANDFHGKFYAPHMRNTHTDETKAAYVKDVTTFVEHLNKKLVKSGKNFIAGDKLTIGDFMVAAVVFNYIENPSLGGGAEYTDKGKEIIKANAAFNDYVERLKIELAGYLASRPAYPF